MVTYTVAVLISLGQRWNAIGKMSHVIRRMTAWDSTSHTHCLIS
jgi:hypothetical protein